MGDRTRGGARRVCARVALSGLAAVGIGTALPLGVAHAEGEVKWTYIAQYESREGCDIGATRMEAANPGTFRCVSNGNPASGHDTFALYQLYYT